MATLSRALLVRIDGRTFALEAVSARGVVALERVTPLPRASELMLGLIPVRGSIVPLINLARLLGVTDEPTGDRAVLAEAGGQTFAFPTDDIEGFSTLEIIPVPGELVAAHTAQDGRVVEVLQPLEVVRALTAQSASR